jgi:hypothetical protein
MKLFGNKKEGTGDKSSSPVASEKTKSSASFLKRTVSKIGSLFSKTNTENTVEPMSNAEYLGEIYKLMVQNSVDIKLEREERVNYREEEDSEEQKRHSEIIKALTIRRKPKPKKVIRREKKATEKAAPPAPSIPGKPGKPSAPSKPSQPPTKPAEPPKKPAEPPKKPAEPPKKPAEPPKKPAEPTKPAEPPKKPAEPPKPVEKPVEKPKTTEPVKEVPKKQPTKPAEPVKPSEPVKPPTATQKPPAAAKPSAAETATKIGIGTGIAAATTGLVPILAKAESPDYNLLVYPNKGKKGIKPPKPLTQMKIGEVLAFQDEMSKSKMYPSNAVGKYQIIQSTLKEGAEKLKIPLTQLFDEKTQDKLYYEFLTGSKRKNLGDYLSGKVSDTPENLAAAQLDLSKEFASFGVPYRIWREEARKKNGDLIWDARWIEPGQSYYVGAGGNKASVTPQTSAKAIKEERLLRLNKEKVTVVPSTPNSGTKADQASKENKDMKKQDTPAPINIQQNTTNVNNSNESSNAQKVDDRPAHQRK